MSGIEVAGLALAIFPLCIQGLKYYAEGAKAIADMRHHRRVLEQFCRELDMEKCKFLNTCEGLFEDMVTAEEFDLLMSDPGGKIWSTALFQEKLSTRMRRHSIIQFLRAVEALRDTLDELNEKFTVEEGKSAKRTAKRLMKRFTYVALEEYRKTQLGRIEKMNADIDKLVNGSPRPIAPQGVPSKVTAAAAAEYYKRVRDSAVSLYGVLKDRFQAPGCSCQLVHDANLQLEFRKAPSSLKADSKPELRFSLIFSFDNAHNANKPLPWNWRELDICSEHLSDNSSDSSLSESEEETILGDNESMCSSLTLISSETSSVSSSTSHLSITKSIFRPKSPRRVMFSPEPKPSLPKPSASFSLSTPNPRPSLHRSSISSPISPTSPTSPSLKPILSLCNTLTTLPSTPRCLGILIPSSSSLNIRHSLHTPSTPLLPFSEATTITLDRLFTRYPNSSRAPISRKDRLVIGVQLASSVLQLYKTAWLPERWGRNDVYFIRDPESRGKVLGKPLVRTRFMESGISNGRSKEDRRRNMIIRCNQSLLSLGIILLELWYWKRLEDLEEVPGESESEWDEGGDGRGVGGGKWDEIRAHGVALDMIELLYDEAGSVYGDVVRRCVRGLDIKETSFDKEEFKKTFWGQVVNPLEENLRVFCPEEM